MAVERYTFICHGIHYLRTVTSCNIHICMGLVWLISGAVSLHGGLVLSQHKCGFQQQTGGLLCNAFTIKEHIALSWKEGVQLFGPPSVIGISCIVAICCCYGCMYCAALRVTLVLKRHNHRANRTVGFYLLMFLLQLALNMCFVSLAVMDSNKIPYCKEIGFIVTPPLIILPSGIIAIFHLIQNPQIRQLLFAATLQRPSTVEVEVDGWSRAGWMLRSGTCVRLSTRDTWSWRWLRLNLFLYLAVFVLQFLRKKTDDCCLMPLWTAGTRGPYSHWWPVQPTQPYGHNLDTSLTDVSLTFYITMFCRTCMYVLCISINQIEVYVMWIVSVTCIGE